MTFPLKEISSDVGLALVIIYLVIKEIMKHVKSSDQQSMSGALSALSHLISAQTLALEKLLLGQDAIRRQIEDMHRD